jgi:archaellum component FlaC
MKKKMEKTKVFIGIRLTDDEYIRLKSLMSMMGYRCVSLFIRDQLLKTRVQRRNLRRTEANLSRQLEQLTTEVKRIGVNYNQVVKALNTLAKLRDSRGNAVVTSTAINGNLTDMKLLMESLLTKVMMIGEEINNV